MEHDFFHFRIKEGPRNELSNYRGIDVIGVEEYCWKSNKGATGKRSARTNN
jgi:hypothetical protein